MTLYHPCRSLCMLPAARDLLIIDSLQNVILSPSERFQYFWNGANNQEEYSLFTFTLFRMGTKSFITHSHFSTLHIACGTQLDATLRMPGCHFLICNTVIWSHWFHLRSHELSKDSQSPVMRPRSSPLCSSRGDAQANTLRWQSNVPARMLSRTLHLYCAVLQISQSLYLSFMVLLYCISPRNLNFQPIH